LSHDVSIAFPRTRTKKGNKARPSHVVGVEISLGGRRVRALAFTLTAFAFLAPALPAAAMTCADVPAAQAFVDKLQPGPNTSAAQSHLNAARAAGSETQCVAELQQVNKYAQRSADADKRKASGAASTTARRPVRRVQCADTLHQNRPNGTDYHGPRVPYCP